MSRESYECSHLPFINILSWSQIADTQLPCGFTIRQSWVGLKRAWKGYKIAKDQDDIERMYIYAKAIQKIESQLGIAINTFPHLGLKGDPLVIEGHSYKHTPFEKPSDLEYDYFEEYDTAYQPEEGSRADLYLVINFIV